MAGCARFFWIGQAGGGRMITSNPAKSRDGALFFVFESAKAFLMVFLVWKAARRVAVLDQKGRADTGASGEKKSCQCGGLVPGWTAAAADCADTASMFDDVQDVDVVCANNFVVADDAVSRQGGRMGSRGGRGGGGGLGPPGWATMTMGYGERGFQLMVFTYRTSPPIGGTTPKATVFRCRASFSKKTRPVRHLRHEC
jgi:hypothetical protein